MREHPIPQDIVGYRFHIVGSMTLKQFAELAIGAILGMIIYATSLPAALKWPLIFFAAALGAAAAFLPIEERPLDHWLTVFFQALYKPTKFFWRKSSKIPDYFLFEAGKDVMEKKDDLDLTPIRRERIKEYLASVRLISNHQDSYDQDDQLRLAQIMKDFEQIDPGEIEITKQIIKPDLKVKARSLKQNLITEKKVVYEKTTQSKNKTLLSSDQVAKEVEVPAAKVIQAETDSTEVIEEIADTSHQQGTYIISDDTVTPKSSGDKNSEESAIFNASLPFPSKPTQPNKLVGMILNSNNELISEAIVEIKDEQNRVVRAIKSNALGQFFVSTPLRSGSYTMVINHPKFQFNPQEITLVDELVEPIEIRSFN